MNKTLLDKINKTIKEEGRIDYKLKQITEKDIKGSIYTDLIAINTLHNRVDAIITITEDTNRNNILHFTPADMFTGDIVVLISTIETIIKE